ncbi:MAG: Ldh family oxidoreductase [Pirellulales bacterium]|nr:Ldh family oxidoreductase [Pirellulales bacterium]
MMEQTATKVSVTELEDFCHAALRKCGVEEAGARLSANVLVTTDAFGVFTHGTKLLRGYVRRLQAGGIRADAVPRVEREGPAWAILDGQSGLGMVTSVLAMNKAIEKAKTAGVGYAGARNSCHFGAAGYYALMAARADMIGLAMANDYPSMAVLGARKAVLGTNPFAYAVPAGREPPIFLDIASSTVAGGKVRIAQMHRETVPDTWMVDTNGVPTTNPFLYPHAAFLLPFAGHKGYGLAMMIEHLAGILTGTGAMYDLVNWVDHDPSLATHHGGAFLAFNVAAITSLDAFKDRVDQLIRDIHETPKADGVDRLYVPGEMEWDRHRRAVAQGIDLPEDVVASLRELAELLDIAAPWLGKG